MQSRFAAERFLARITQSAYKDEMVLKGGYLIGAMVGLGNRSTHDLDYSYQKKVRYQKVDKFFYIKLNWSISYNNLKYKSISSFISISCQIIQKGVIQWIQMKLPNLNSPWKGIY